MLSNILNIYCKNIFNNFLIAESCRTRTHFFQKLPSPTPAPAPAPAPESRNAPVLHRYLYNVLLPIAWISDSILLVILPFANFDSVTQWEIKYITTSARLKIQRWNLIKSKKLIYEKIISRKTKEWR